MPPEARDRTSSEPSEVPEWLGVLGSADEVAGRTGIGRASLELLRRSAGSLKGARLAFELHGPTADAHAQVRRSVFSPEPPAPFDVTVSGIDHARAHGVRLVVVSRLSRSSMRVLREQASLIARLGASDWCLCAPWIAPELDAPQVPRAAMATPFALDAAVRARRTGLMSWLHGFPLCLMGPHAGLALPSRSPASGEPCDGCPSRTSCAGLGERYRSRFGSGEIRVPSAATASPERDPWLASLLDGLV